MLVEVNIYVGIVLTITRVIATIVINMGDQVIYGITSAMRPVVNSIKARGNNCYNCSKMLVDNIAVVRANQHFLW